MQSDLPLDQTEYDYGEDELVFHSEPNDDDDEYQERYQEAKKLVKQKSDFYYHLMVFAFVSVLMYFLDMSPDSHLNWAYWIWFGWGIGVAGHFISLWEEGKIHEMMNGGRKRKPKHYR